MNRGRFPVRVGTQKSTCTSAGKNPTFELLSQGIIHAASESTFTWSKKLEWKIVWQVWISRIFADMSQIPNTFCVKAKLRQFWRCMEEPPWKCYKNRPHLRLWVGHPPCTPGILADWQTQGGKNHTDAFRKDGNGLFFFCWHGSRLFFLNLKGFPHFFWVISDRINKRNSNWGVCCASVFLT